MRNFFLLFLFVMFYSTRANAYIGLGPLIPVIGGAITFILTIIVAFFGIIAFPIKKIIDHRKNKKKNKEIDKKI
jgi:hypothetical protein